MTDREHHPFFTVGHSNRTLDDFIALLQGAGIERIVDVRAFPMSRANPQFNKDRLPGELAAHGIDYAHVPALGGRRSAVGNVPPDTNGFWENAGFHNYADYALTAECQEALGRLVREGRKSRCAVMCSEAVWWRCHRRLIADNLIARGETVCHVMERGRVEAANLTDGAEVRPDRSVVYPATQRTLL